MKHIASAKQIWRAWRDLTSDCLVLGLRYKQTKEWQMQIVNGMVVFDEPSEKAVWESTLQRPINEIPPDLLRQLGEARVKELMDEGCTMWARMVAHSVSTIPPSNLH